MDTEAILNRFQALTGATNEKQLADILGMKAGNFSARKKKGTLWVVITEWAVENKIDTNWLLMGIKKQEIGAVDGYLGEIKEWLDELSSKDPRKLTWFEIEFEKYFPDFTKWKQKREQDESEYYKFGASQNAA
ncbi:MAG: hypothetical protein OEV64_04950 [Desulfobulbaceae bacterium]|nr:hypothetical protein [Desulfobulbaceae bacterium]